MFQCGIALNNNLAVGWNKADMKRISGKKLKSVMIPFAVVLLNFLVVVFPKETLAAAKEGLGLWLNGVLPSLLPFIVGVNVLSSLGVVNFAGTLLEPIMQPLFRVPGSGGFALVTGLLSGYPLGAKVTAGLRADGTLNEYETQRLASFTNNSGPLFIIGVVGAGMFGSPLAGYYIYAVHLLSALICGLIFRNYKRRAEPQTRVRGTGKNLLRRAYASMQEARRKSHGGFGQVLSAAVVNAMETLLMVGGFVILFSVIVNTIDLLGVFSLLERLLSPFAHRVDTGTLTRGILSGLIEVTNGAKTLSVSGASREAVAAAAFVISWGGLSIHAQAVSFLGKTDIKLTPYFIAKLLHGALAAALALLFFPLFNYLMTKTVYTSKMYENNGMLNRLMVSCGYFGIAVAVLLAAALAASAYGKLKRSRMRRF